jgi:hypothetical protein
MAQTNLSNQRLICAIGVYGNVLFAGGPAGLCFFTEAVFFRGENLGVSAPVKRTPRREAPGNQLLQMNISGHYLFYLCKTIFT